MPRTGVRSFHATAPPRIIQVDGALRCGRRCAVRGAPRCLGWCGCGADRCVGDGDLTNQAEINLVRAIGSGPVIPEGVDEDLPRPLDRRDGDKVRVSNRVRVTVDQFEVEGLERMRLEGLADAAQGGHGKTLPSEGLGDRGGEIGLGGCFAKHRWTATGKAPATIVPPRVKRERRSQPVGRPRGQTDTGAEGARTLNLRIANATLSQLSYRPRCRYIAKLPFSRTGRKVR